MKRSEINKLTGGKYYLDGQLYHMDIHGFAPYSDFSAVEATATDLTLELTSGARTLTVYPRRFGFRVIYALCENTLLVTYEVENRDQRTMYFGLGAHPGFQVPLRAGKSFEDYRLRFQPSCRPQQVGFTADCFLDGTDCPFPLMEERYLPLAHDLFDDDAIVLRDAGHQVTLETEGDSRSVTVEFPGMRYLGLWHFPRTNAPYVCIEPWCSLPSAKDQITAFEQQADLIPLPPGEIYRNTWKIIINGIER